jgi:hypothetical protein
MCTYVITEFYSVVCEQLCQVERTCQKEWSLMACFNTLPFYFCNKLPCINPIIRTRTRYFRHACHPTRDNKIGRLHVLSIFKLGVTGTSSLDKSLDGPHTISELNIFPNASVANCTSLFSRQSLWTRKRWHNSPFPVFCVLYPKRVFFNKSRIFICHHIRVSWTFLKSLMDFLHSSTAKCTLLWLQTGNFCRSTALL